MQLSYKEAIRIRNKLAFSVHLYENVSQAQLSFAMLADGQPPFRLGVRSASYLLSPWPFV
jgi:hypothetical protein